MSTPSSPHAFQNSAGMSSVPVDFPFLIWCSVSNTPTPVAVAEIHLPFFPGYFYVDDLVLHTVLCCIPSTFSLFPLFESVY